MKKSLFMKVLSLILVVVLVVETTLTYAATLSFTGQVSSTNSANTWFVFYTWCYTPVDIYLDTAGISTTSIDVKFVLSGTMDLQTNTGSYPGFIAWVFNNYLTFAGVSRDSRVWTGKATSGTYNNWEYRYINAYMNIGNSVNSGNAKVATVYLKPIATTGILDFYYFSGINMDDSNVTSGYNNNTQYADVLYSVAGTGNYTIINTLSCPFRPYVSGSNYMSLLGSWLSATNAAIPSNKDKTSLTTLNTYWIISPTWPQYSWYITQIAWHDLNTGNYTSANSWHVWTNQPITIYLTGNESFLFDTGLFTTTAAFVKLFVGGQYTGIDSWTTGKTIVVTGNISTGINFYNSIGNLGQKYKSGTNNYQADYQIDVFWYDTLKPNVTWFVALSTAWHKYVSLSWYASSGPSNASSWRHADRTTDDDMFRIVGFSGTNTTSYGYSNITGYNADLNALYVFATGQDFSMVKTGINSTTYTGFIDFTQPWSGYIYLSDIAGNVTWIFVNIDVQPKVTFEVRVSPAFRNNTPGNGTWTGLAINADIWLATNSGSTWTFIHNSVLSWSTNSWVVINPNGTGSVDVLIPVTWTTYLVVLKGSGMLAIWWTWVWTHNTLVTSNNILDFVHTWNSASWVTHTWIWPSLYYQNTWYLEAGDVTVPTSGAYDYVNGADLNLINQNLSVGQAFSTIPVYYDFDINAFINAIEQAIIIQFDSSKGFIDNYATWGNSTVPIVGLYKTWFITY